MKLIQCAILTGSLAMLVLMFLVPPFMVIDPDSDGRAHAYLGRHAIWNPPSSEYAFHVLYPDAPMPGRPQHLASLTPRINRVRLASDALIVAFAAGLAIAFAKWIGRNHSAF